MGNKNSHRPDPRVLQPKQIAMLAANTPFTEEEIKSWHTGFIQDCPSGKLDKRKFIELYKQIYPSTNPVKFADCAFNTFDTDHSGKIDFTEFLLAIAVTKSGDSKEKLEMAFDMYDIDNNGFIDEKELVQILNAIYDLNGIRKKGDNSPKKKAGEMMKRVDINKDAKISREEFIYGCINDPEVKSLLAPCA